MGTHFHLIVYTTKPTLSAGMRRLCGAYAQWFNWKYQRRGHLFAGRFASSTISEDPHLLEAHRYVALNPVRANLCHDPADWHWGSYRALCGFEPAEDFLDVEAVHGLFSVHRQAADRAFRRFVHSGIEGPGSDPSSGWGQTPDVGPRDEAISSRNEAATRPTASS
jgi:putative transposase